MMNQVLRKIILIDASLVGDELVVDLTKKNRSLYKSTINDCLDVNEIVSLCKKKNIDYSFGTNELFNPIINLSFIYPETKFYIYSKKNDEDKKTNYFILNNVSVKDLDLRKFKDGIYKDENGKIIAVKPDSLKENVTIDGLKYTKNGVCQREEFKTPLELREKFYKDGFKVRYILNDNNEEVITYKRYKRSASAAKAGECYFIREDLFNDMMNWTCLGGLLKPDKDPKIYTQKSSWEAYIALSLSGIEKSINIPLDSILIVKDIESKFKSKCINVTKNGDVLDANEEDVEIKNSIWDGEGLLDESVFNKYGYEKNGMILLRNRFLKSCVFNTKLQKWFKDNNITSINQLNGVTNASKIEDIKLVITESSLKLLKFADDVVHQEAMNDLISRIWTEFANDEFGVVKHDKKTKFFNGKKVQATYQLLNTLDLSRNDIEKLFAPAKNYYAQIANDAACLRYHLKMRLDDNDEEESDDLDYASFKEIVAFELLKSTDKAIKTKVVSELLTDIKNNMRKKLLESKILIDGTYATLFSNGYELLNFITYKGTKDSFLDSVEKPLMNGEIMCSHFKYNSELLCARNPHITMGNLYLVKNKEAELLKDYFNLSSTIVCVNSIGENLMQRLNGADFDSDTMLITNEKILIKAAKKNYDRFLVPVFDIEKTDANHDLVKLDDIITNNYTGEIVNKSQTLNSIYWNIYHQKKDNIILPELYKDICKLAVLSNLEIDKAKKNYAIDSKKAIRNIEKNVKKLGLTIDKPNFLKGGKASYETACCYVQEKGVADIPNRVKQEGSGKLYRIFELLGCKGMVQFSNNSPEAKILAVLNDDWEDFGSKRDDSNQYNKSILDQKFDLIKDDLEQAFNHNTVKNLFANIEDAYQNSNRDNTNAEAPKTLYLLYFIYKLGKFNELFKGETTTELIMSSKGDIEMYGYKFKKKEIKL